MLNLPSGKAIMRAGENLSKSEIASAEDLDVLNQWRLYHSDSLVNTIEDICQLTDSIDDVIVTGRIKRKDSIIKKLRRDTNKFLLHRLNDIAGVRVIVKDLSTLYKVVDQILDYYSEDVVQKKDPSHTNKLGYRAAHLVLTIQKHPRTIRIEIQVRTIKEHAWASMVEINDYLQQVSYKTDFSMLDNDKKFKETQALFRLIGDLFYMYDCEVELPQLDIDTVKNNHLFIELMDKLNSMKDAYIIQQEESLNSDYILAIAAYDTQEILLKHINKDDMLSALDEYNAMQPDVDNSTDAVLFSAKNPDNIFLTAYSLVSLDPALVISCMDEIIY